MMGKKTTRKNTISARPQVVRDCQSAIKAARAIVEKTRKQITQNQDIAARALRERQAADKQRAAIEAHRAAVAMADITDEERAVLEGQALEALDVVIKNQRGADNLFAELTVTRNGLQRILGEAQAKLEALQEREARRPFVAKVEAAHAASRLDIKTIAKRTKPNQEPQWPAI